ncbi:substrate-binding domain-containing protein [Hominiventricola filiformis]|uniref:Substrate-binding domain-containing protein n=1 Tax=Hominiventricola filiformis TaxID=2885352 RepID=A0AAE3DCK9_9FIRM|nr:substrate-binding domain-containing protein [Hominiventricola filiformis]MCC2127445.1 substrate-binding domain-containing protein [Hominiventricola filiformis]
MKKTIVAMMIMAMTAASVAGCGSSSNDTAAAENTTDAAADTTAEAADDTAAAGSMSGAITVLSREDGSGTRGAFIELFGIEQKDADGNKVDNTIDSAEITNSTSVMMTTVAGNKNAIGYVSLGSLDENQVKAVLIDGAQATAENVKDGTYKVSRPFNIATKGEPTGLAKDFIDYILSEEGQAVVEENGYVSEGNTGAFEGTGAEGKITVGGSSSVTPVMEKLKEAYAAVNPNATIEVQQSDSTTGMTSTIDGTYDIGMASRELKDEEAAELTGQVIALDGIAVIVNKENTIDELTSEDVLNIYTGATTDWSEIAQ